MAWEPARYEQFKQERYLPFEDLVALINVRRGLRVIDLGCGTGELTRRLAALLPESDVLGIDSSAEMLARAEALARPGLRFERRAIEDVKGEWDLVFSHAAIQWVADHASLVPRLLSILAPGGQLAVQVPSNFAHPTHAFIDELVDEPLFRDALSAFGARWSRLPPVLPIDRYAELLYAAGAEDITVLEKVYPHVLAGADALADWMEGTALVPYRERLSAELYGRFVERYRQKLRERYPSRPVLFGFRRTLFVATRPG